MGNSIMDTAGPPNHWLDAELWLDAAAPGISPDLIVLSAENSLLPFAQAISRSAYDIGLNSSSRTSMRQLANVAWPEDASKKESRMYQVFIQQLRRKIQDNIGRNQSRRTYLSIKTTK
jgi:hypothetical protein